jgi:hypothetical protein
MKTRKKTPRSLADIAEKLFPNSPIEVVHEDKEYHIYVEGQWNRKSETLPEVFGQVDNILFQYGDDWWYPSTRINPTWAKWPAVSVASLAGFTGRQHE